MGAAQRVHQRTFVSAGDTLSRLPCSIKNAVQENEVLECVDDNLKPQKTGYKDRIQEWAEKVSRDPAVLEALHKMVRTVARACRCVIG